MHAQRLSCDKVRPEAETKRVPMLTGI